VGNPIKEIIITTYRENVQYLTFTRISRLKQNEEIDFTLPTSSIATMPGIFNSCITSPQRGLCSDESFVSGGGKRVKGIGSAGRNSKSNDTSQTALSSISGSSTQGSGVGNLTSLYITSIRSGNSLAASRGFYSNKANSAMLFFEDTQDDVRSSAEKQRNPRQYQPSPVSAPCEWGYFVDTA